MDESIKKSLKCPNCGANVPMDCVQCDYCRSILTVTACPACFGPVFKGAKFCPDCGSAIERDTVQGDRKLTCPRCEKTRLAPALIGGVRIDECGRCGGIWLDKSVFEKVVEDKEQQEKILIYPTPVPAAEKIIPETGKYYIPCPICGSLMLRKNFLGCSGVIADWCKDHGTWFDRQELQQIVNFMKSGGLQKARDNEVAKLQAEQERLREMKSAIAMERNDRIHQAFAGGTTVGGSLISSIAEICRRIFMD